MNIDREARCFVKLEKLNIETILVAQHGIRDCFVKLNQNEVEEWIEKRSTTNNGTCSEYLNVAIANISFFFQFLHLLYRTSRES